MFPHIAVTRLVVVEKPSLYLAATPNSYELPAFKLLMT